MKRIEAEDPARHLAGIEEPPQGQSDRLAEKVQLRSYRPNAATCRPGARKRSRTQSGVYVLLHRGRLYGRSLRGTATGSPDKGFELMWNAGTHGTRSSTKESTVGGASPRTGFSASEASDFTSPSQVLMPKKRPIGRTRKLRVEVPMPAEQRQLEDYQKQVTAHHSVPVFHRARKTFLTTRRRARCPRRSPTTAVVDDYSTRDEPAGDAAPNRDRRGTARRAIRPRPRMDVQRPSLLAI